jgi:FkbM family methyltransferase
MPNDYLPPQRLETKLITAKLLKEKYTADINSEVYGNNWYLGCSDLAGLAPYIRIVMDRLFRGDGKRHLIFDVGANNGQDASTILGIFQTVIGMCEGVLSNNVKVISVEPSPKVFCELEDLVKERIWTNSQILRLNIGLSDTSGVFQFADPGHEGGSLNTTSKVTNITHDTNRGGDEHFNQITSCRIKNHSALEIDEGRVTEVPTYTMDELVSSVLSLVDNGANYDDDNILTLKIDTEGHDIFVIKGANQLLADKRITFVIFEVWSNANLKAIAEFMDQHDYFCFLIYPKMLVPVHPLDWWYPHLDNHTDDYWANGFCGIRSSRALSMLYKAFHADDEFLLGAHDVLMKRGISARN